MWLGLLFFNHTVLLSHRLSLPGVSCRAGSVAKILQTSTRHQTVCVCVGMPIQTLPRPLAVIEYVTC